MRLDFRATEVEIPIELLARAFITVAVKQINVLRSNDGLAPITRDQVIAAVKDELKNLT